MPKIKTGYESRSAQSPSEVLDPSEKTWREISKFKMFNPKLFNLKEYNPL